MNAQSRQIAKRSAKKWLILLIVWALGLMMWVLYGALVVRLLYRMLVES